MEKILEKLFDINKIPTKLIFVIWGSVFLILFVPETYLEKLILKDFLNEYGKYIGISFVISSTFLFLTLLTYFLEKIKQVYQSKRLKSSIIKYINNLDNHEKALLREYLITGKSTLKLPMDNETVVGIENKRLIYRAADTGFTTINGMLFPYTLSSLVIENLKPHMLDIPEKLSDSDKKYIITQRPLWAIKKDERNNTLWK